MKKLSLIIVALVLVGLIGCGESVEQQEKERAAQEAAQAWLKLVDSGKYAESWDTAAAFFKGEVTKAVWLQSMNNVRKPLGNLVSRELKSSKYATSLPGAPDGEYVVITYSSTFESKRHAIETVTPVRDQDGEWYVSGYFIR